MYNERLLLINRLKVTIAVLPLVREVTFSKRYTHTCIHMNNVITLLADIIAHIPVGQKQQRQARTAGTIQS